MARRGRSGRLRSGGPWYGLVGCGRPRPGPARWGAAWLGLAWQGEVGRGRFGRGQHWSGGSRSGVAWRGRVRRARARFGEESNGMARLDEAGLAPARLGLARRGVARAWRDGARHGVVRSGEARLGIQPGPPRYFLLRLTRHGPLVPGRLRFIDHEPGVETNKRTERWPALLACADVAGEEVDPTDLTDRLYWPPSHWKSLQPISAEQYQYRFELLRWAERNAPSDPMLRPRRRVSADQVLLPSFDRENAL